MNTNNKLVKSSNIRYNLPEKAIIFQLVYVLFERFFIQLGAPNAIIYLLDIVNIYLLLNICIHFSNIRFNILKIIYCSLIGGSILVAIANYGIYGNNSIFTLLEIRNLIRFIIFFFAATCYFKLEHVDKIFKVFEVYFWINSLFIIEQYFTYFPPTASWMRGDLLNGFFGNVRGGNTFVNVLMLVVVLYLFVKWTKKECTLLHLLLVLGTSVIIAGLIELKVYFLEIAFIYMWYLIFVKKTSKEKKLNVVIIASALLIGYAAIQIMLREYPWFESLLSIEGLLNSLTSTSYSSSDDLNRLTGVFTIADKMFHGNVTDILFGIGLGNGAVSEIAGRTTAFAAKYFNSNYSWFSGTYLFVQCGLIGLVVYISSFIYLIIKKKINIYKTFSNMIILLSIILVFYGEALKTDAGYLLYFAIATGFLKSKQKKVNRKD